MLYSLKTYIVKANGDLGKCVCEVISERLLFLRKLQYEFGKTERLEHLRNPNRLREVTILENCK